MESRKKEARNGTPTQVHLLGSIQTLDAILNAATSQH